MQHFGMNNSLLLFGKKKMNIHYVFFCIAPIWSFNHDDFMIIDYPCTEMSVCQCEQAKLKLENTSHLGKWHFLANGCVIYWRPGPAHTHTHISGVLNGVFSPRDAVRGGENVFCCSSARHGEPARMCAPVRTVCLALINPLPIGHDMFISLLPVCIVNAKPQPALQRACQRVLLCVDVQVQENKCRELLGSRRSQIHTEISAGI